MEDILASIRRILNEDEVAPQSPNAEPPAIAAPATQPNAGGSGGEDDDGVLVLDEGMLVAQPALPDIAPVSMARPEPDLEAHGGADARPALSPPLTATAAGLLAPESAAAAASSVGALLRTISNERGSQVYRGGPTVEDLVREEVRPLLKQWLDQHLPPMVERLVRQEIERVTGRATP